MTHTEFIWVAETVPGFEKNHLYRVGEVPPPRLADWLASGKAKWREDVPPQDVVIDLQPHRSGQVTVSKPPRGF